VLWDEMTPVDNSAAQGFLGDFGDGLVLRAFDLGGDRRQAEPGGNQRPMLSDRPNE
jgi:hypothetical protein